MSFSIPALPDVTHLAAIGAVAAGLVLAWVQLLKPAIETKLAATSPMHDPVIRYLGAALAVAFLLVGAYAPAAFNLVAVATGIAIGSYGGFHLITSNPFAPSPGDPPVTPPVAMTPTEPAAPPTA